MGYEIHSRQEMSPRGSARVMFQSLAAAGKNSVADPRNGFDEKATYDETRGWHENPDGVSFIGSMGRREGDPRFSDTALKSEGIKPAGAMDAYMIDVDGTAFTIEGDTPLSVYAGVEFDPALQAVISFDNHVEAERAINELTGGQPAWVRMYVPQSSKATVKNRSVPGFEQTIPLKELGAAQTVFGEVEAVEVTFEGYYLPRGAADQADGIYYGLQEDSPGFLHVHDLPSDIDRADSLTDHNDEIRSINGTRRGEEPLLSIGGHALAITEAQNVVIEIMPIDGAFVKTGMNRHGRTIMRPLVGDRDLDAEKAFRAATLGGVMASGFDLTTEQLDMITDQYILDRDRALQMAAGKVVSGISPEVRAALADRVELMEPRALRPEHLQWFGLDAPEV